MSFFQTRIATVHASRNWRLTEFEKMRKFLLCLAALLPAVSGLSQDFSLVTRAEFSSDEEGHLGNSSFYFTADGNFTDNLSYSAELHLLSSSPADLYTSTFYSNTVNWLDWLDLTYDFGPVQLSAGKEIIGWGTFENQEYDFDSWYELASTFWLGDSEYTPAVLPSAYAWGTTVNWNVCDGFDISAQATVSPFGERPFASGLFQYDVFMRYGLEDEDGFSWLASFNLVQTPAKEFLKYGAASLRYIKDSWAFTLDNSMCYEENFCSGHNLSIAYSPLDNLTLTARGGYEQGWFPDTENRTFAGLLATWYPWEQLRVHALATYDSLYETPLFNIGVTWTVIL